MKHSDQLDNLFAALAKARAEFPAIEKSQTANIGTYSYKYADLPSIFDAVVTKLSDHGLTLTQGPTLYENNFVLATTIGHASGQFITYHYPIHQFDKAQSEGSEQTYKRRYAINAALGIHPDGDDDGANTTTNDSKLQQNAPSSQKAFTQIKAEQQPKPQIPKDVQARLQAQPKAAAPLIPSNESKENLGSYEVQFGKKYFGRKLSDITIHELNDYLKWAKEQPDKKGKMLEFIEKAELFLNSRMASKLIPSHDDIPESAPFDPDEELPF